MNDRSSTGKPQPNTAANTAASEPAHPHGTSTAAALSGDTPGGEPVPTTEPNRRLANAFDPRLPDEMVSEFVRGFGRQGRYKPADSTSREQRARLLIGMLKAARVRHGLTIVDVAVRAGVHKSVIGKFENETTDPRLSTLLRYADAVNVDLAMTVDERQSHHASPTS